MSEDDFPDSPDEDSEAGCRQLLQVNGEPADLREFRRALEESERWGSEVDWFLKFGEFDPVPDPLFRDCLLYTSPSPRDGLLSRMPSSA